ncbi:MAG: ribosome maturation factor RimP [Clostridia bacterium]|nr:ribosome maturation factor RimP [Clostridia bacterium]MCD8308552.1 ribosome maturation factor RimP [Clostridia bacterium]
MNIKPIEEIRKFFEDMAAPMGIEVVDVEFNQKTASLTVYIETESGVDLDTCEKYHNAIMDPIDELDPTYGAAYTLNVSSPGLDRPFKTNRDFERNLGKEVEVKLFAPLKGKKFLEGFLIAFDDNSVTINTANGEQIKLSRNKIAKINKAVKFD